MKAYETSHLDNRTIRLFPNDSVYELYRKNYPNVSVPLGIAAVHLFWEDPDEDYIKTYFPETDEVCVRWGLRELAIWMGGVALTNADKRILDIANRDKGAFDKLTGWRPDVIVSYLPSSEETDLYARAQAAHLEEEWRHFDEEEPDS